MADEIVGSAYVIIRAITNKIRDDIKEGVKKGAGDPALNTAGENIGDKIGTAAGKRASKAISSEVDKGVTRDRSAIESAGEKMGRVIGSKAGRQISDDITNFMQDLHRSRSGRFFKAGLGIAEKIGRGVKDVGRYLTQAFDDVASSDKGLKVGSKIGKAIGSGLGKALSAIPTLPFAIFAAGLPLVGGALKVLTSYVSSLISLVNAAGPAFAGMAAVWVSSITTVLTAVGVFKIALSGIGTAVAALNKAQLNPTVANLKAADLAMKGLSPTAQTFAKTVARVETRFKGLRKSIQEALLPSLGKNIESLSNSLLPILQKRLTGTATILARVTDKLARLADTPLFKKNLSRVLGDNNVLLGHFGNSLVHLVSLFTTLLASARPVIRVFGQWIDRLTGTAAAAARAGERTGKLQGFFQRAAASMKQWGAIIGNFAKALGNVFKIGAGQGQTLVDGLQKISEKFLAFTRSAGGQNKIATYFRNGITIMRAFNHLLGDIFKTLGSTLGNQGSTKGTVAFIEILRTKLLPALVRIAKAVSSASPKLIELANSFGKMIDTLSKSGSLGTFVATLKVALDVVNKLLAMPFVGQLLGWAIALGGIGKALNLLTFGGFGKLLGPLGSFLGKTKLARVVVFQLRFALLLMKEAALEAGASLLAALGPVGLIVVGVIALAAAFIYAYKHSEAFRKIVDKVFGAIKKVATTAFNAVKKAAEVAFNWLKGHWKLIAAILFGPFGIAVALIIKYWDDIKRVFVGAFKFIVGIVKSGLAPLIAIWKAVWGLFGPIVKASFGLMVAIIKLALAIVFLIVALAIRGVYETVKFFWGKITEATSAAWHEFKAIIGVVVSAVKFVVGAEIAIVKRIVSLAWHFITAVTARVWRGLVRIISAVWSVIRPVVAGAVNAIKHVVSAAWDVVSRATARVWNGLKHIVGPAIKAVLDKISGIKTKVVGFFDGAKDWLVDAGKAIIQGLVTGINKVKDKVNGAVKGVMKKARDLLPFSPAKTGPFSGKGWSLYSGQAIVRDLAKGIHRSSPTATNAVTHVMRGVKRGFGSAGASIVGGISANVAANSAAAQRFNGISGGATTTTSTKNISIVNNINNPLPERAGKSTSSVLRHSAVEAGWVA